MSCPPGTLADCKKHCVLVPLAQPDVTGATPREPAHATRRWRVQSSQCGSPEPVSPFRDQAGDHEVVLLEHHHVTVSVDPRIWQSDISVFHTSLGQIL